MSKARPGGGPFHARRPRSLRETGARPAAPARRGRAPGVVPRTGQGATGRWRRRLRRTGRRVRRPPDHSDIRHVRGDIDHGSRDARVDTPKAAAEARGAKPAPELPGHPDDRQTARPGAIHRLPFERIGEMTPMPALYRTLLPLPRKPIRGAHSSGAGSQDPIGGPAGSGRSNSPASATSGTGRCCRSRRSVRPPPPD